MRISSKLANSVDKRSTLDLEAHGTNPSVFSGQVARAVGGAGRSSLLAAAHMEDIVAFVSDDENLTTVVAGVAVVGATIVGGLYASTRETAAQEADSGEKLEQAPRIGGRQKKKAKGSKPVLPKKASKKKEEKKARWDVSSDEEEEPAAPEPAAPPPQVKGKKKKGKKGKKADDEDDIPVEAAWEEVPKKVAKKRTAAVKSEGGKVVIDLADSKAAVIGKGGSVIKQIQVRAVLRSCCRCCRLTPRLRRPTAAPASTSTKTPPNAPSPAPPSRCARTWLSPRPNSFSAGC